MRKIADAGLIIAALDERDACHGWAKNLIQGEAPPWLVCEPVLTEISASIGNPAPVLEMLRVADAYDFSPALRLCSMRSFCKSASDLDCEVPSTVFSAISCTFW